MSIADHSAARQQDADEAGQGPAQGGAARHEYPPAAGPASGASEISRSYTDILRSSVDWLWQTDADLNLTYISHSLADEDSGPVTAWVGHSLLGVTRSEAGDATPSPLLLAVREHRPFRDCTVEWTSEQQQTLRFRLTGLPFYDQQTGGFAGYRGTGNATAESREDAETAQQLLDLLKAALSERDQLQKQLAQAEAVDVQERLAAIAHELRTPLNAVIGFSELIRDQAFGDEPARYAEYGANIHRSGLHLLQLINRILDTAEHQSGAGDVRATALDVADIVRATAQILSDTAAAAGVDLSAEVDVGLPKVLGDRQMTRQILFHLLARAIARAPNATSIGIRTDTEDGAAVLVTVWDGALSETPPDPEDTADAETEDSGEAADLGPVVLQHLAQTMGASLAFSGHSGRGGRAILRLPVAPPETE